MSDNQQLLHSRFKSIADNTIDYWMKEDSEGLQSPSILEAIENAPWLPRATLQLYLHVAYCAQACSFCAFSGGNSLDFKTSQEYANLLIWQMKDLLLRSQAAGKPIASVNIGGGSPDLLKTHIASVLEAVRALPGCNDQTEISVEFALSTVTDDFLDILGEYKVTKASFGIQTLDSNLRRGLRMPSKPHRMEEICERLVGKVPIINADLITGFPGHTIDTIVHDHEFFINHPIVNSISSYLLTPGAAPQLIADIETGHMVARPDEIQQALFRLHSYTTLQRYGWVRKGTNTYMSPEQISAEILSKIAGNECIGARRYEDFLIGCGPQAISCLPGVRAENTVDITDWMKSSRNKDHSFALSKCSLDHQKDMALWVFPLMADGLASDEYEALKMSKAIDEEQIVNFEAFRAEGLIFKLGNRYKLSITGEVFMGHLVRNFKKESDQKVIQEYIEEGYAIGKLLANEKLKSMNSANNRQITKELIQFSNRESS
jgi:oxygen-independent coproporphyrinogen-3 oxidase